MKRLILSEAAAGAGLAEEFGGFMDNPG